MPPESESTILKENDSLVRALWDSMQSGLVSLEVVPGLIKKIIKSRCWQRRMVYGRGWAVVEFNSFEEFATAKLPEGLETSIQSIRDACSHDPEALKAIEDALQKPAGNPSGNNQYTEKTGTFNNIQDSSVKAPTGTSRAAGLRRLKKDRPDLYEEVGKTMTVNEAMVKAGFRVPPLQISATDPVKAAATIRRAVESGKIDPQFIEELKGLL
jgi:hypothetical protein